MRKLTTLLLLTVTLILAACSPVAPGLTPLPAAPAVTGTQVGLVITPAEGEVTTVLASVTGDGATALDALAASGVDLVVADTDFGPAICAILTVGQPIDNCFGDAEGRFWSFFILGDAGEWEAAQVGAGGYPVSDGEVLGFSWTGSDANYNPLVVPPVVTFAEIAGK